MASSRSTRKVRIRSRKGEAVRFSPAYRAVAPFLWLPYRSFSQGVIAILRQPSSRASKTR